LSQWDLLVLFGYSVPNTFSFNFCDGAGDASILGSFWLSIFKFLFGLGKQNGLSWGEIGGFAIGKSGKIKMDWANMQRKQM
jgi:hypothetical protein